MLGLAKNERLKAEIAREWEEAAAEYRQTGTVNWLYATYLPTPFPPEGENYRRVGNR